MDPANTKLDKVCSVKTQTSDRTDRWTHLQREQNALGHYQAQFRRIYEYSESMST
jgi:hypothetical protein